MPVVDRRSSMDRHNLPPAEWGTRDERAQEDATLDRARTVHDEERAAFLLDLGSRACPFA